MPSFNVDPDLVHRVLANLVDNAIRHAPDGTTIRISARRVDGLTEVRVIDAGPGVPTDVRARVFERFVSGGESGTRTNRGLGLAFCKLAVEAHGGRIGSRTLIRVRYSAFDLPMPDTNLPFRQLVDAAPDGLIVCDARGTIQLVNAEAERMFGYTRGELFGKPIDTLVPDHVRPRHDHHLASYTAAPRLRPMGSNLDLRGRRKDGTEFPVEISLSPIESDHGLLITAGIRDMTERRKLEREHKRANAYLVSAVDAVQDAFTLFDEQDRVMMVNSAARQLLGGPRGETIVGRRFDDLLRDALATGVFDFSNETRESLHRRWVAYHRAPSGTLEVRTGTGRYLRVTERKTADHGTVSTIADVTDDVERAEEPVTRARLPKRRAQRRASSCRR